MSDYDYIITIDENGSPCLQHALFGGGNAKGSQRQNHKYYARAQDKGRWRYFYSPEEFRAWSSGATRKVKQAVNNAKKTAGNAAGEVRKSLNARRELNEANKATGFGSGLKQWNAQRKYNQTAMGRAENAVRGAVNQATGRARQAYDETRNKLGANASDAVGTARKKIKNLTDAVQEHGNKTLSELRNAAGNARSKAEEVSNAARRKAEEAAGNARDKASEAAGRVRKAAEDKSGVTDQKNRDEAHRRAMMGLDGAAGDYTDSDNRYQKSAKGRADKAADRVKDAAEKLKDKVDDVVGTTAKRERDEARRRASMGLIDPIDDYSDRENSYNKTARGRIENAPKNARDLVDKAGRAIKDSVTSQEKKDFDEARRKASMGLNDPTDNYSDRENAYNKTPRGRAEKAVADIRDNLRDLASSVGSKASNAASRAQNAAGEVTGSNAKKEMDAQGRKAMMGLDDAIGSFVDAQTRYENSAGGRASSAASNAQASMKAAQSKAKQALAKAMDYLPEDQIEAIKELIRGK